ncbi:MAG: prepilin peptidase [Deltaproteobacteria bacterium]|nr:prepilin peptidase [Deltaproteobacteria bacterium]
MILPSKDFRRTHIPAPEKLHTGLDGFVNRMLGAYLRRPAVLKSFLNDAFRISREADKLRIVSNRELRSSLSDMKAHVRRGEKGYEEIIPLAMAALVEAAYRNLGLRPFPVQIAGALALHSGYLAEMATGEGKSLTACLPAILAAWTGRPCHIITVNDYLADRDAVGMSSFYEFCGVSVGSVTGVMDSSARRVNYEKGVVYTTSKELVADFLRDRLIMGTLCHPCRRLIRHMLSPARSRNEGLVMRGIHMAIVDEADSVLIDEAVTPLIISQVQENMPFVEASLIAGRLADSLLKGEHYHVDLKYQEIIFLKATFEKMSELSSELPGIWQSQSRREELITQALTAREFYRRNEQYVIQDGKIVIVDEFTGRLMPNRTWRQGLHQAVEAKESLELTNPSETLSRLSFQQFFRFFRKLSGMTGTGAEAAGEFWQIYRLPVLKIPTNRPCIRKEFPARVYETAEKKWDAIKNEIIEHHNVGRPVLVGTRNVKASERLAEILSAQGLEYNLLNAVRHEEEAAVIRVAGEEGRITISTNMAGRGTDIKLQSRVVKKGGLHVIATEQHESRRIDRQLFGRSARQGDPGSGRMFISVDDELIKKFVPGVLQGRLRSAIAKNWPGAEWLTKKFFTDAQRSAQRLAYKQRKNVLRMDTWLEEALSFTGTGSFF